MSIHLTESNYQLSTADTGSSTLNLPADCMDKPAGTGFVAGMWMRSLPQGAEDNASLLVLSRGTGSGAGGDDSFLAWDSTFANLQFLVRAGGSDLLPTISVATPSAATTFLALVIQTSANIHFVTCVPGGTPTVTTQASTALYTPSLNAEGGLFERIGAASTASSWYGDLENVFLAHGDFPEAAGVPDNALIQAIADGSKEISDLAVTDMSGSLKCHFPMLRRNDYADVGPGAFGSITPSVAEDADVGRFYYSGGYLRPDALRPTDVGHWMSPLKFTERGNIATATCTIRAEGGTYHGITPSAIEARLVKDDGTAHVDWTVIDSEPSGGTWTGADFTDVAATTGYLDLHFRAVDGGGTAVTEVVPSKGLRGTSPGALHSQQCQSQGMYLWKNAGDGTSFDASVRLITTQVGFFDGTADTVHDAMQSSTIGNGRATSAGIAYAANEINALFPGYPIQLATIGESGNPADEWETDGAFFGRHAVLGGHYGIDQPDPIIMHFGHSDGPAARVDYYNAILNTVGHTEDELGIAYRVLMVPTPLYGGTADGATHNKLEQIRAAIHDYARNNGNAYHLGSFAVVKANGPSSPHPSGDADGQGRAGSLMGLGMMAAQGAIAGPVEIKSKSASGTSITLTVGPTNRVDRVPSS